MSSKPFAGVNRITRRYDLIVVLLFFAAALVWSRQVPIYEAPDEHSHYEYVKFLTVNGRLPEKADLANLWEGFQPPLYYMILASFVNAGICETGLRPVQNSEFDGSNVAGKVAVFDADAIRATNSERVLDGFYFLRALNALFGALFIWTCFALARALSVERMGAPLITVWAFTPVVISSAATMTNDALSALFCVAGLLFYQYYRVREQSRFAMIAGIFMGLGMITKTTTMFLWASLIFFEFVRVPRLRLSRARLALLLLPVALSIASVARSLSLHPTMPADPVRLAWMNSGVLWSLLSWPIMLIRSVYWTLATAVGVLGSQVLWLPGWVYGLYLGVLLIFIIAASRALREHGLRSWSIEKNTVFLSSVFAAVAIVLLSVVRFRESGETMHARLLLGYLPGITFGIAAIAEGYTRKVFRITPTARRIALTCAAVSLLLVYLPTDSLSGFVGTLRTMVKAGRDVPFYVDIVKRGLLMAAVLAVAWLFSSRLLDWIADTTQSLYHRVVIMAIVGALLNLGLLVFYVVPMLAS